MIFERIDLKSVIDAVTSLVIALGILYTAIKAKGVHTVAVETKATVATIEKSVNGTATKAQDVINELRKQLEREKEISAEKTQTAAVLQASTGQKSLAQQTPIETKIVNENPIPVITNEK